jgi:hypothetical protein
MAAILAARTSLGAKSRFAIDRGRLDLRENPSGETLVKCAQTAVFHLESGGYNTLARQNNNFLDSALHFVIC